MIILFRRSHLRATGPSRPSMHSSTPIVCRCYYLNRWSFSQAPWRSSSGSYACGFSITQPKRCFKFAKPNPRHCWMRAPLFQLRGSPRRRNTSDWSTRASSTPPRWLSCRWSPSWCSCSPRQIPTSTCLFDCRAVTRYLQRWWCHKSCCVRFRIVTFFILGKPFFFWFPSARPPFWGVRSYFFSERAISDSTFLSACGAVNSCVCWIFALGACVTSYA